MSGEFGSYRSGHFWEQMQIAAEDLEGGHDPLTKKWGVFFRAFERIAHDIAWSEAYDTGPEHAIMETIKRLPDLKQALAEIEQFVKPYQAIAEMAVKEALKTK